MMRGLGLDDAGLGVDGAVLGARCRWLWGLMSMALGLGVNGAVHAVL